MEDLLFSLQTVFPLVAMMGIGFAARRVGWIDIASAHKMNSCVFHIFLPLLLVFNLVDTPRDAVTDTAALVYGLATTLLSFALAFWLVPKLVKQRRDRGVVIQCICRSNYAVFGIPLVMMMYPSGNNAICVLMVAVAVPVFNVMSTIALMIYGGEEKPGVWRVVRGVLLNPLILGTAAGLLLWRTGWALPGMLASPLRTLSKAATPLALFLLGASLDLSKARASLGPLVLSVAGRLVIVPLLFLSLAVALGFRDVSLATMIALYASPVAVSSFPMTQQIGGNDDLAGSQVLFSTLFSIVTVFLWILALRGFGFLG